MEAHGCARATISRSFICAKLRTGKAGLRLHDLQYRLLGLPVVKEWVNYPSSSNGLLAHFVTVGINKGLQHHTRRVLVVALFVPVRTTVVRAIHHLHHWLSTTCCIEGKKHMCFV